MEEEQTTQWSKEQKDKQRSTKHTHRYKVLWKSWHSCSTSGTQCVNLVTNPVISHALGTEREVFTTSGTYSSSFVTQIFHSGQSCHCGDCKTFDVMTSNNA